MRITPKHVQAAEAVLRGALEPLMVQELRVDLPFQASPLQQHTLIPRMWRN